MPKLTDTLTDLLSRLAAGEKAPTAKLGRGLEVLARNTPAGRQFVLNRPGTEDAWKLKVEAQTVAKHAGWASFDLAELVTRKGGHCLTVTEKAAPAEVEGTCGSCANGVPSEDPGMIDCTLGWEAHDQLWSLLGKCPVTMAHGEATVPTSTPNCRCGALIGNHPAWTPKRSRRAA